MKKKKFDLMDETMQIGKISTGTMIAGSMPGLLSSNLPGTQNTANKISTVTSKPLSLLPTIQATSSVFGSLRLLEDQQQKIKKWR